MSFQQDVFRELKEMAQDFFDYDWRHLFGSVGPAYLHLAAPISEHAGHQERQPQGRPTNLNLNRLRLPSAASSLVYRQPRSALVRGCREA